MVNQIDRELFWDDFMSIGTELNDSRFGPRVVKVNVKAQIKFRAGLING